MTDGVGTYDPMHGSVAFSLIGFSGGAAAGIGSTETARWDNSVKYVYQYGPAHAAVMYSNGGSDTAILGNAVAANVGASYRGLSVDAFYTKENAAVAAGIDKVNNVLDGTITNNEAYSVMAKYTMDLGGGYKDEGSASKLTFFGGYVYMDLSNPDHLQGYYANDLTQGGYALTIASPAANAFGSDKISRPVGLVRPMTWVHGASPAPTTTRTRVLSCPALVQAA